MSEAQYLLFAGEKYYAGGGARDLIAVFQSEKYAVDVGNKLIKDFKGGWVSFEWFHVVRTSDMKIVGGQSYACGVTAESIVEGEDATNDLKAIIGDNGFLTIISEKNMPEETRE